MADGKPFGTEDTTAFDWREYTPAIRRWERVVGRPAPYPVEPGTRGQPRLASRFVEWLMGLPAGYVTDLGLPRSGELRALGNGVVPQQAEAALTCLLSTTASRRRTTTE
jgi:DNA (cytosine-5)-methyltransferase 1